MIAALGMAVALVGACVAAQALASTVTPLKLLSWPDAIDPHIASEFEAEYRARLIVSDFESDDRRDADLAERAGRGHDVIIVDATQVRRYARRGWLEPLDRFDIPNRSLASLRWPGSSRSASEHGVANSHVTLGIAWREDLWPTGFDSWEQLISPDPSLAGRLLMVSNARELIGVSLKAAGHSANTSETLQIEAAGERLASQRPFVGYYGYARVTPNSPLVSGAAVAAMIYSNDALRLQSLEPRIRFRVPREGGLLRTDYLSVSAHAEQPELAARFIDFLNRPRIAARQARFRRHATPNRAARELLTAELLQDPIVHPPRHVLHAAESLLPLPVESQRLINAVGAHLMIRR